MFVLRPIWRSSGLPHSTPGRKITAPGLRSGGTWQRATERGLTIHTPGPAFCFSLNSTILCHDPPDRRRFIALALELDDNYVIEDAQLLQRLAWTFLIFSQEEAHLLQACDWAKQALKIEDNCEINTLVAAACLRLKEKNFGIRCAKRAIELGKKEGVDTRMPESLLKDLQELE